jgi:Undecaprenyl-phosphate glucose phosphotransferase
LIHQRSRQTAGLFLLVDLVAIVGAFFLAWWLRFDLRIIPLRQPVPPFEPYLSLVPLVALTWPVIFYFHGLYRPRRGQSRIDELATLVVAIILGTVILLSFTAFYRPPQEPGSSAIFTYSRAFLGLFFLSSLTLVATARFVLRSVLRRLRRGGYNLQRILIVGAGKLGKEMAEKLHAHRELGFEVIGFLDDDPGKTRYEYRGVPVLGTTEDVGRVIESKAVDQVLITLPLEAYRKSQRVLEQVNNECIDVRLVPDIFQYSTLRASLEELDGTPIINLSQVPLQGWNSLVKRAMDIGISSLAMLALLPFLPLLALAIWLEDRGPIFYRQERMGLDGRPFMILKFRSMRVGAENSTGPIWAVRDDPRRTRIGAFLRRTSLDELPQLWNVFKGEMSIIGPRPERPAFVSEFKSRFPNYMLRHRVKAGITGWAQVHGWRGNTSIRKRLQYDLYYIQNWTLGLDLKILWMTLRHGMRDNAY